MQEGYVIPAYEIIDDIRKSTKARELRLPTMNDVLGLASRYGNVDLVKSLIATGVVINERPGFAESSTALLEAAEHEQLEVIKLLLSAGAKFDKQGGQQYGRKTLLAAGRAEHFYLVEDLISAGAQPRSSPSVPSRTSTVEGQAYTYGLGVGSLTLNKTEGSRLTTEALKKLQKSTTTQLDNWVRQPERHEQVAIGSKTARSIELTIDLLRRLELGSEIDRFDTKRDRLALPPTIMSH